MRIETKIALQIGFLTIASLRLAADPSDVVSVARAAVADFNGDGHPDYVLFNATNRRTAIWHLNNNVFIGGGFGPVLPTGWGLIGAADFNLDGHTDYALLNSGTHQTAIWYLSGRVRLGGAYGPTIPSGWALVATADFNADARPDYVLYNPATRRTAIWYMNNNVTSPVPTAQQSRPAGAWSPLEQVACPPSRVG